MKRVLFIATLLCFVLQGCSDLGGPIADGLPQLDETVNGMTLSYGSNQKFRLCLDSWADAGYQWDYTLSDSNVANVDGAVTYRSNSPGVPGGLATATVVIHTGRSGDCKISLFEHQQWMKDVAPRKTVTFTVVVAG
jgi:predicted secreted protein